MEGSYIIPGLTDKEGVGVEGGYENRKLAVPVPGGNYGLQVSYSVLPFVVQDGKISVTPNSAMGVRFDPATNTFRFNTVTIEFVPNGF